MTTTEDYKSLARTAQRCVVEYKSVTPLFGPTPLWIPAHTAQVVSITHTAGMNFNTATVRFPADRWHELPGGIRKGSLVRIRTATDLYETQTVLFEGIVTRHHPSFSGGTKDGGAFEHNDIDCLDYRWLLHTGTALYGQFARGVDDYDSGSPLNKTTFMSARRCVFNPAGRPNRDPNTVSVSGLGDVHVFCPPRQTLPDGSSPVYWTARQMLQYVLMPDLNPNSNTFNYHLYGTETYGTEHADFDTVLSGINVDGLSAIEAADLICRHLGWSFRQDDTDSGSYFTFYKVGTAAVDDADILLHELHAPAAGESITAAVAAGQYLCCDAEILDDITAVTNNPVGIGAPETFEFTAELIRAWDDADLVPDTENLFKTESELMAMTDPDSLSFYNKYHTRGSGFLRNVGRKWALNETGAYTGGDYDRGDAFNFASVFPSERVFDDAGKRLYGLYPRTFVDPLSFDAAAQLSPAPIKVEFSFDGGSTWKMIDCVIENLSGECAVRIAEPNLSNIVLPGGGTLSGGTLDDEDLNYWTALAADKLDGTDNVRLRVTASVQADQRLAYAAPVSADIASPYTHRRLYDFSDRYTYQQRTDSSEYATSGAPAWDTDQTDQLIAALDEIRDASEDASLSGRFTLDRLWLGDGEGALAFKVGDAVARLTGRGVELAATINGETVHPEIAQIHYDLEHQKMHMITRDLRLTEAIR
ncbi:MAG: hypothetical protein U9R68_01000 [Planctomycetota bacterium]|nr:hypothetical protein [Planctomycetota bacterium]